jgi:L-ribulose-5-phosphate 3-epimerase
MNRISFNCSNLVAQQYGYYPEDTWDACVAAVNAYYSPPETFAERFEQMILQIKALDFDALDIWTPGQLSWRWASAEHIATARALLDKHQMAVTTIGGDFGETRAEFVAACKLAVGVNTKILSGVCDVLHSDRAFVVKTLEEFDVFLSVENHPETSPRVMLAEIGDTAGGRIGTTIDTGWWATQHYDVVRAIEELGKHIMHVHLKDVRDGPEHINVGYGQGIVPLEASVRALKRIGYTGDYSIENHPTDHDPIPEIKIARGLVREWLA